MSRAIFFYFSVLVVCGLGIFCVLRSGANLQSYRAAPRSAPHVRESITLLPAAPPIKKEDSRPDFVGILLENLRQPFSLLLLQLIAILAATRGVGSLFRKIGQPAVLGEMVAGILLGPSLLGTLSPAILHFLFPPTSLPSLRMLSQIGVILFLFVVGMDMEAKHLRKQAHTAVLVSHASILIPFLLGVTLALWLYLPLAPPQVPFHAFALFLGTAMSITAFPVLARILEERGLTNTYLGNTAIACAAVDDVTAWCILALVVAIAKAEAWITALLPVSLTLLFIGFMLLALKPRMNRLLGLQESEPLPENRILVTALALILACAWFTETIGIHALFGAFLAGVILPEDARLRAFLRDKLAFFSMVFLLPLFFAFTGLRTQIGLLNDPMSWLYGAVIIIVAIIGKLGGSLLAARWSGLNWPDAFALGSLMNTRGLVELIVLNIGYDMGVLSPPIFAMLVLMALTTTFMTGPLLTLADLWRQRLEGTGNREQGTESNTKLPNYPTT